MKKIFLLLAFTGIVGAASANTFLVINKASVIAIGDEKKGDDKKKEGKSCSKEEKAACRKGEGKACCHAKSEAKAYSDEKSTGATKVTATKVAETK